MTGFLTGRQTEVLLDQFRLSPYLSNYDPTADVDIPPTTTYASTAVRRQVVGLKDAQASLSGFHDAVAGGSQAVLTAAMAAATASVLTVAKEGLTIGKPAELMSVREKTFKSAAPVDGVVPISVDLVADGGIDFGVSLHALAAETTTANSASVDNGAATTNGGVGHIHATAISGTPTLDDKIQHSTDNITFPDLITFTQLTAAGKQRVEVAAGTTVNRYVREAHTIGGGTPSITYAVAFARR
jgi:hypothetical protein